MKRVIVCKLCKGKRTRQIQKTLLGIPLPSKVEVCNNCSGTGYTEHLQQRCLTCGQFCGNNSHHKHNSIIEV